MLIFDPFSSWPSACEAEEEITLKRMHTSPDGHICIAVELYWCGYALLQLQQIEVIYHWY